MTIEQRIREAVRQADDAFWDSVANSFPEASTGDLGVEDCLALMSAENEAVERWVRWNVRQEPRPTHKDEPKKRDASCRRELDSIFDDMRARAAVAEIVMDLCDRSGLKQTWAEIAPSVRREIVSAWRGIIVKATKR